MFVKGKLPMKTFPDTGFNLVHRDDVVDGIILALEKGRIGEAYNLGGEITTMSDMLDVTATVVGRKPLTRSVPVGLLKVIAPLGPLTYKLTGFPPNLREAIKAADGVTYWARDDKARRELGYDPRPFEEGIRQTLREEGLLKN
jgi:dihydroflavonol-4-reductase